MTQQKKQTGQLTATDPNGNQYRIIEYTDFADSSTFGNPNSQVEGLKSYRLPDGSPLNKISDTEFEIVHTGIKLRVSQ